ncbi:BLUF domain-containing protein [Variovorax atrisoli]|uniref:BLUF domain-containing protein n=1 Tax=Variovorax atrisoli TaxID=3394203 RepID=UPI000F7D8628|nr:BLUF domain-containing protein [Variovorax sp. 369]RTD84282.1 BLUF domain-containing protein [Variovorax sp. 369]
MLARLVYVSKARGFRRAELNDILQVSRARNERVGITGALCVLDGVYMQYLEGQDAAVEALYKRIEVDPRHQDVTVLDRTFIAARVFSDWAMALLSSDERIKAAMERHGLAKGQSLHEIDPACAAALFRALAQTPNWLTL